MHSMTLSSMALAAAFACVASTATLTAQQANLPTSGPIATQAPPLGIPGLRQGLPFQLDIHGEPGAPVVAIPEAGVSMAFDLRPHSVRGPGYQLLIQDATGALRPAPIGPVRTYRGTVLGRPGSSVAGGLHEDGLYLRIELASGEEYGVQPIPGAADSDGGLHVLYRWQDVVAGQHSCGTDQLAPIGQRVPHARGGGGILRSSLSVCELAFDADYEYFLDWGSTNGVENRINTIVNTVNVQYERDVQITHVINTIIVRTSSAQPYTSTDASTLLNQFRSHWNANQTNIQRDTAHLMTGKSIDGGTIGIAWVGVICNGSYGYGLSESDFNGVFSSATDLTAHELGHNWNASHCQCTSYTMNPYIVSANQFNPSGTIPTITSFRDGRSCLTISGGGTPTSVSVLSIAADAQSVGRGQKRGVATVQIVDDLGNPVANATVSGTFTGDVSGPASATTNGSGVATLQSPNTAKGRVRFTFCVTGVSASLPYASQNNVETCDGN